MSSDRHAWRRPSGFTLIETMVALVVVALGMTAVYMQLGQFASNSIYLRDKSLASWIASNELTNLSIAAEWPALGDDEVVVPFADRSWLVTIDIAATEVENLRRADISVALEDRPERILHTVSGLIEPPPDRQLGGVSWHSVSQGQGARR